MGRPRRAADRWPLLSIELQGPRDPEHCQACGGIGVLDSANEMHRLLRWVEHDAFDRPTSTILVLCVRCSGQLIEPHPRLYSELGRHAPCPGAMPLCARCTHHQALTCTHPDLKANGGPGLTISYRRPLEAIACTRGRGAGHGCHHVREYPGPVSSCAGRTPTTGEQP